MALPRIARDFARWFWLILKKWALSMSGGLSAIVGLIEQILGNSSAPYWWLIAGAIFLVAIFLVWRDAFREARPYDEETFRHAREVFAGLTDDEKGFLEKLCIRQRVPWDPKLARLESPIGWVVRNQTTGIDSIDPAFLQIVARLVKEWRTAAKNASSV